MTGRGGRGGKWQGSPKGGRGSGNSGRGLARSPRSVIATSSLNADQAVPMLRIGGTTGSNWDYFKRKMSVACMESVGNLGRLIDDEAYYVPPLVVDADFGSLNPASDPHGIRKAMLLKEYEGRHKEIRKMKEDRTKMYAYIYSKLSKESQDEVARDASFATIEAERDPLKLWMLLKTTHMVATISKVPGIIKKSARSEYEKCKQGEFESIVDFKRKFDTRLEIYKSSGNDPVDPEDAAMDFLYALDDNRYAEFKADLVNDLAMGTLEEPPKRLTQYICDGKPKNCGEKEPDDSRRSIICNDVSRQQRKKEER